MGINVGFGKDEFGKVVGQGIETYNPQYYEGDVAARAQKLGIPYYGGGHLRGEGILPFNEFNEAVTKIVDTTVDSINIIGEKLPDNVSEAFTTAVDSLFDDYFFETKYHGKHPEDWAEEAFKELGDSLQETFTPTVDLFVSLNNILDQVSSGFSDMLTNLAGATNSYFGTLLGINNQIIEAGGTGDTFGLLVDQLDTYKLLFDNAVENNLASALQLGQQYANALVAMDPYAENLDLVTELERVSATIMDVVGAPEDFQASILTALIGFKEGVQESIDAITTAIKELHPEVNLDIDVDLQVTDSGVYYDSNTIQRAIV